MPRPGLAALPAWLPVGLAALLLPAAPGLACSIELFGPVAVPARGIVEGGMVRGPDCATAIEVKLFLKARTPGVDRILARAQRTLRDGRIDLAYACRGPKDIEAYMQLGENRGATRTQPVRIPACG